MEINDIYDLTKDLIESLIRLDKWRTCSEEYRQTTNNYAKVKYAECLLEDHHQFRKLEAKFDFRINKNVEKSVDYRKEGNGYFSLKNKNYFQALQMYNKSICFAEKDSENLSIGYANRSAVLFEWKRYKECLENIKLAKEAHYPERLMNKLIKREENCLELLATQEDDPVQHEFKLSYDSHKTVPFIADCLDMKYTKELGRYIYTTKDLNPGDLVSIEKPFSTVLLPPMRYVRCANCNKENYLTLIPCPDCTCTMFCSKECMEEGFKIFHKYECPLIDLLYNIFDDVEISLLALRTCLIVLSLFETVEECIEFCNNPENENQNAFTLNYNNFTKLEHYRAIHGFATNQDKKNVPALFQYSIACAVLTKYLFSKTLLGELLIDDNHKIFFTELLFRHFQTGQSSMSTAVLVEQKDETKDDRSFAGASYAVSSLLNHSCAPNTLKIYQGTTLLMFVLRPIPANQPLYDNYGFHFARCSKKFRQNRLKDQYCFICQCEACENDYPQDPNLPRPKEVPEPLRKGVIALVSYNREYALNNYEYYLKFFKDYEKFYPCEQLYSCEELAKMSLNIIADAVPLKAKMNV